jgi:hypothetical protein
VVSSESIVAAAVLTVCDITGVLLCDNCSIDATAVSASVEPSACPPLAGVSAGSLELWASSLVAGTV